MVSTMSISNIQPRSRSPAVVLQSPSQRPDRGPCAHDCGPCSPLYSRSATPRLLPALSPGRFFQQTLLSSTSLLKPSLVQYPASVSTHLHWPHCNPCRVQVHWFHNALIRFNGTNGRRAWHVACYPCDYMGIGTLISITEPSMRAATNGNLQIKGFI